MSQLEYQEINDWWYEIILWKYLSIYSECDLLAFWRKLYYT